MQHDIFFSIIVPSYNRATLIAKTLQTLQQQAYVNYEIIVVDDGSTDNTEEVVQAIAKAGLTTYHKKNNAERAAARNYGAKLAKGEYVNFFDSDDLALTNHLAEAAKMVQQKNNPEWFHLGYEFALPEGKVLRKVDNFQGETLNSKMGVGNLLSCNGVFVKRDVFLQHLFNEDRGLSASEDYELWMRLSARYPLYFNNVITSIVVDHEARSVLNINKDKLIERISLLTYYLEKDNKVMERYGADFNKLKMELNSYIALHLANKPATKLTSVEYTFKALFNSLSLLGKRRFYAIIKTILLKW